ncbi:MAG: hypothetical protein R2783_05080 [Gelidibacter sp.]
MGKLVTINLSVEASALYLIPNPSPEEIDELTFLSDDNKGKSGNGTNEDFVTEVYINSDVKWKGKPLYPKGADKDYSISIDSIEYEKKDGDTDFFDKTTIYANGDNKTTVTAKTKNDRGLEGLTDIYTVNFSIHPPRNGKVKSGLSIDPKLKMSRPDPVPDLETC